MSISEPRKTGGEERMHASGAPTAVKELFVSFSLPGGVYGDLEDLQAAGSSRAFAVEVVGRRQGNGSKSQFGFNGTRPAEGADSDNSESEFQGKRREEKSAIVLQRSRRICVLPKTLPQFLTADPVLDLPITNMPEMPEMPRCAGKESLASCSQGRKMSDVEGSFELFTAE
ncbi:hypothetical protein B0H17DRAFT_1137983 [Mycena rosella]|uniref:Uncharacterized protein n=1 Tax=Mycena rosella TaxID=1033263 RepID=A0AAD7GEY7_MYCRO|nr:hypothetical protein B0H17DRAFT_1137983 [Mycena rosella]